jgi:plasmid stabilization system protein ParE
VTSAYKVLFSPESEEQLAQLYRYIAAAGSPDTALSYTQAIVEDCESLAIFPERGAPRHDVRAGLRVTNYRGRVVIAYTVISDTVHILGIFYGGQDYESLI